MTTYLKRLTVLALGVVLFSSLIGFIGLTPVHAKEVGLSGTVIQKTSEGTKALEGVLILVKGVPEKLSSKKAPDPIIDQVSQTFEPHILPVLSDKVVKFKNSEMVTHNVRLIRKKTGEQLMNKMTFPGQTAKYTFKKPGVVSVNCDIHPSMLAYVVVVDTPFVSAKTSSKGKFSLKLPSDLEGSLSVRAWSEELGFSQPRTIKSGDLPESLRIMYSGK